MKQFNLGMSRVANLIFIGILLLVVMFTGSIVALAFMIIAVGVYVGVELFVIFSIVYSMSQVVAQQMRSQQTEIIKK